MSPDDVGSIAFPFAHIAGPDYLVRCWRQGFPAVIVEAFVPDQAIRSAPRNGVTMAGGGTAFYQMFLAEQRKQPGEPIIPTLRIVSGGGAPMPPEIFHEVQREMGIKICHGYGMTEIPMISQGSPHDTDEQLRHTEGTPVYGAEVRIVTEDGPWRRRATTARCGSRARWCARATPTPRSPPRRSTTTAGSAPATSATSATTATSCSPAG